MIGKAGSVKDSSRSVQWIATLIIGVLVVYCGAVLIFMGINGTNAYKDLELYGETTEGTVSKISTEDTWKGGQRYITVEYQVNNMDYSYVDKEGYFGSDAQEGDTLTVVYDPIQPLFAEEERTTFGQTWGYHFLGGGAAVTLGVGIAVYGIRIRKSN